MANKEFSAMDALRVHGDEVVRSWQDSLLKSGAAGDLRNRGGELRAQADEFLRLVSEAARSGEIVDVQTGPWKPVREFLTQLSTDRARQGYSSTQTASFIFSMKESVFAVLRREIKDPSHLATAVLEISQLLDQLGLLTVAAYQQSREEVIARQQEEMLELSTPVVTLW